RRNAWCVHHRGVLPALEDEGLESAGRIGAGVRGSRHEDPTGLESASDLRVSRLDASVGQIDGDVATQHEVEEPGLRRGALRVGEVVGLEAHPAAVSITEHEPLAAAVEIALSERFRQRSYRPFAVFSIPGYAKRRIVEIGSDDPHSDFRSP